MSTVLPKATTAPEGSPTTDFEVLPTDALILKVFSLRISDLDLKNYALKVTFFDYTLLYIRIEPIGAREEEPTEPIANGRMLYNPSDFETMSLFADYPLVGKYEFQYSLLVTLLQKDRG